MKKLPLYIITFLLLIVTLAATVQPVQAWPGSKTVTVRIKVRFSGNLALKNYYCQAASLGFITAKKSDIKTGLNSCTITFYNVPVNQTVNLRITYNTKINSWLNGASKIYTRVINIGKPPLIGSLKTFTVNIK
jgi:hypothetical protein